MTKAAYAVYCSVDIEAKPHSSAAMLKYLLEPYFAKYATYFSISAFTKARLAVSVGLIAQFTLVPLVVGVV